LASNEYNLAIILLKIIFHLMWRSLTKRSFDSLCT
jgi:hypothetical protein